MDINEISKYTLKPSSSAIIILDKETTPGAGKDPSPNTQISLIINIFKHEWTISVATHDLHSIKLCV